MNYVLLIITLLNIALSGFILWRLLPRATTKSKNRILLDTSALMDGRVLEVVRSGFVATQLVIPRFVIAELQLLADKADHLKRERARYGLQVIQDLQDSRQVSVSIVSDDIKTELGVDEKLVKLARRQGAMLFTTDFNLLKVAEIEGIRVLNVNELAQNLRPTTIPGETAEIKIVGKGQERHQGVGYLPDGTLVVVENAGNIKNQSVKVEFTRNLQTTAGRMMFAKITEPTKSAGNQKPQKQSRHHSKAPKNQNAEDKLIATINSK